LAVQQALLSKGSQTCTQICNGRRWQNNQLDTISSIEAYKHGVVTVIEFAFSDASTNFIKVASNDRGTVEIGGTNEMGTGTRVNLV
jgi:hypothetical protein